MLEPMQPGIDPMAIKKRIEILMRWLILRQLRPFLVTAGAAGVALNLALLIPSIYILSTRYLAVNGGTRIL